MSTIGSQGNTFYSSAHNYAVIISGGMSKESNSVRYWNDCSYIYSTLTKVYSYKKDHIFSLISDGDDPAQDRLLLNGTYDSSPLDLDGDGEDEVHYAATYSNLKLIFNKLSKTLTPEDNLFIYTIDHGYRLSNGHVSLVLWGSYILDEDFAKQLGNINARSINICMGQCFSGGFIPYLQGNNRVISTACSAEEVSYSRKNRLNDEFVYEWTAAVNGSYPDGQIANADTNKDGIVSMDEAFVYAKKHDTRKEHPQFSSSPESYAGSLYLISQYNSTIHGNSVVCDSAYYYIPNLPQDFNISWSYYVPNIAPFPILEEDNPQRNECVIYNRNKYPYNGQLTANIEVNGETIAKSTKDVSSSSGSFSGTYKQESCSYYGVQHPAITSRPLSEGAMFVYQGCRVIIESNCLKNRKISYNGIKPDYFYYDYNKTIDFVLPLGSGGIPFNIRIGGNGECFTTNLLFFTVSNNGNLSNSRSMKIALENENSIRVGVISEGETSAATKKLSYKEEKWHIDVYNGMNGQKVFSGITSADQYLIIDSSNWDKGVYVIRAQYKDNILSSKFTIK